MKAKNRFLSKIKLFSIKKFYKQINTSLKYKLIFSFLFIILLPTLLYSVYSYISISKSYTESAQRNIISLTKETTTNINYQFDYLRNTSLSILVNSNVADILNTNPKTNIDKILLQSKFEQEVKPFLLFNPAWSNETLKSIFLFKDLDTYYYFTKDSSHLLSTIDESLHIMKQLASDTHMPLIIQSSSKKNIFYMVRESYDLKSGKKNGYLLLEIDSTLLFDFEELKELYPNLCFIAYNKSTDKVISSSTEDLIGTALGSHKLSLLPSKIAEERFNGKNYFILNNSIDNTDLNLITLIPSKDVLKTLGNATLKYIILFTFLTIICIKFYSLLYHGISDPLNNLLENIKNFKNGDLKTKMPKYKYHELNDITDVFNNMTDEIDTLINQVYDKQLLIKESELKFLKSQMDPHFIFNVLDTINWHAKLSNHPEISSLTTNLSKLLRANLSFSGNELISIKEELEYIDYYISLQKSRFAEKLTVKISIADDSLLNSSIPKLCIQPFIENAIVHGIEPKIGTGLVQLQIWEDDDMLYFTVIDDGVGFDIEAISSNSDTPIISRKKGHNSIAIENIQRRLELIYGDNYSINIESKVGQGSRIRVNLPLNKEDIHV